MQLGIGLTTLQKSLLASVGQLVSISFMLWIYYTEMMSFMRYKQLCCHHDTNDVIYVIQKVSMS